MKLSEHIEIVATMFTEMAQRNASAQEMLHNQRDEGHRKNWERLAEVRTQRIESLCRVLEMGVRWPGLYPNFEVEGHWYNDFKDALAATFGCESFSVLLEREEKGFEDQKMEDIRHG